MTQNTFMHRGNFDLLHHHNSMLFVHQRSMSKPETFKLHINQYFEIYIYISGDVEYIVDDQYYTLARGDIIAISPYRVHKAVLKEPCMYERFYILIPADSFDKFVINPLAPIQQFALTDGILIRPSEANRSRLLHILHSISNCVKAGSDGNQIMSYGLFLEFLAVLGQSIPTTDIAASGQFTGTLPPLLSNILIYIEDHLTEVDSIEELARHFHLSLPYFSTYFKSNMGITPKSYIQTKKISLAKKLLDQGNHITDTCYELGYNDCSYFIKIFKQNTGLTPYQYQKQSNLERMTANSKNLM